MRTLGFTILCCLFLGEASAQQQKVIADFEQGSIRPFSGGRLERASAIQGKGSMKVERKYALIERAQNWTGYDYLRFEVVNPQAKAVRLLIEIRDRQTKDYWTRVNLNLLVQPGPQTLTVPTAIYVGEKGRVGRPLLKDQITHFIINVGSQGPLIFDDFRLEKSDASEVIFSGLKAFDFGPKDSPVMDGFVQADLDLYDARKGFGWARKTLWKSLNVFQPEPLTQDFVFPEKSTFKIDLPNGRYRVHMNIDSPGGYWGEVPAFTHRAIRINGQAVLDETWDYASFVKHYYRHAQAEDLPDVDTFEKYVLEDLKERAFTVSVENGQMIIDFESENWAVCLTHLYLYPLEKETEGAAFSAWLKNKRKKLFDGYFGKKTLKPSGAPPPATGYRIFSRTPMLPVQALDGPREGEALSGSAGLSLAVAGDEEAPITFSIQSSHPLGSIKILYSDFVNEAGQKLGLNILQPGWLDYRITRKNQEGSVYAVEPRYWWSWDRPFEPGITRRYWFRIKPDRNTPAGVFLGKFFVQPEHGAMKAIPVSIKILPFALDEISDVAVGPWGSGINLPWLAESEEKKAWDWRMFEKTLDVLKETGCTSFSGRPNLKVAAWEGTVSLKAEQADREMALIRSKGFNHLISSYGIVRIGYNLYAGVNEENARKRKFKNTDDLYGRIYQAVDRHAQKKNWVPVAWNLCDEPGLDMMKATTQNAAFHRRAGLGLDRTTFMGATSLQGTRRGDPHRKLVQSLSVASLNGHDEAAIKTIHQADNRFSFYNGANRWTLGRYMRMLVKKHQLALRLTWHYNNVAGNPYYALDCREDDYCWFNTNADQDLIPSVHYLTHVIPGLNDYRYLVTLERMIQTSRKDTTLAKAVLKRMLDLKAGTDRAAFRKGGGYASDRIKVVTAILSLVD